MNISAVQQMLTHAPSANFAIDQKQRQSHENGVETLFEATLKSVKESEQSAIKFGSQGGDPQQLIEAVMTAERNLQLALSVKDKAVGALQEIMRTSL